MADSTSRLAPWRERLHEIIFEADTRAGKTFDVLLLIAIVSSVAVVSLESVEDIDRRVPGLFDALEWGFTILFTIEYVLRLACVRKPWRYALSFFGIVDLLAVVPTYLSLFFPGSETLIVVRALRLLRVFRIFKLGRFLREAKSLRLALYASRAKVTVFLCTVVIVVVIMGAAMHLVEGPAHGFTSIPQSMYWAIVTMTTVGYGDVAPETPLGKLIAACLMVLGYSFIIVPTGIITAELAAASRPVSTQACPDCGGEGHDYDARHCKFCGGDLGPAPPP
ncbi:MAG: ion transporter [Planctomycetota bacterium]|jgi:voltage-gated potassium channel